MSGARDRITEAREFAFCIYVCNIYRYVYIHTPASYRGKVVGGNRC